jgi:hypothetical protein
MPSREKKVTLTIEPDKIHLDVNLGGSLASFIHKRQKNPKEWNGGWHYSVAERMAEFVGCDREDTECEDFEEAVRELVDLTAATHEIADRLKDMT